MPQDARHDSPPLPPAVAAKIMGLDDLLVARDRARAQGRRLVQCHGCFDIVHPGHIRHLRQARALGDVLLVSITGDPAISKGAGRPLIPEELRAENLAALDCVDLVHIDPNATAQALLERLRPDVYVKGKEYEHNADPRFKAERDAVERGGGRVVFSSGDVVFSSTALIAALEQSADPYHGRLMSLARREDLQPAALHAVLSRIRDRRIVVVGEPIIDTYIVCDRPEVAGESPIMTLRPLEARHYDGGAAIVARHAAALGARPILVTPLPDTSEGRAFRGRLEAEGIEVRPLLVGATLPEKQRFLVGAQKMMKLDLVDPYVLDVGQQERLVAMAVEAARGAAHAPGSRPDHRCDAAIVTDFGLGLFTPKVLSRLCVALRPHVRTMSGDVSGRRSSLRAMRGLDLLCPSEGELRDAMRLHGEGLPLVTLRLLEETRTRNAIVTLGADGLIAFSPLSEAPRAAVDPLEQGRWRSRLHGEHIPALCPVALDPLGCGDSLLTVATLALSVGATPTIAGFLGACAAAVQVQRLGNTPVSTADLRAAIARVHAAHLTYTGGDTQAPRAANRADSLLRAS